MEVYLYREDFGEFAWWCLLKECRLITYEWENGDSHRDIGYVIIKIDPNNVVGHQSNIR